MKTIEWAWVAVIGGVFFLSPICLAQETNRPGDKTIAAFDPETSGTGVDVLPYSDISNTNKIDRDVFF